MKLLAIDASFSVLSVAVQNNGEVYELAKAEQRKHSQYILELIQECLTKSSLQFADLDALVYGQGPGGFTGLRLVSSITQGIAFSHNLKALPISSLHALAAHYLEKTSAENLWVCEDAKVQQVYWGHYQRQAGKLKVIQEACSAPEDFLDYYQNHSKSKTNYLIGSGWKVDDELTNLTSKALELDEQPAPLASSMLALAAMKSECDFLSADKVLPVYLQPLSYKKAV